MLEWEQSYGVRERAESVMRNALGKVLEICIIGVGTLRWNGGAMEWIGW